MAASFTYVGRFAPSPTGPLHAGSLVAALASWLDARAWNQGRGRWLVRIEDLDTARCIRGAAATMLQQLHDCALVPDATPVFQSRRQHLYARARDQLIAADLAYPCGCSRKDIDTALQAQGLVHARHSERVYPGTCRLGLNGRPALAWRFRTSARQPPAAGADPEGVQPILGRPGEGMASDADSAWPAEVVQPEIWHDRRLGAQRQDVAREVGDFVIQRADGPFAYQLAVVVDDADQGVSHVVRGTDLADNTARQILLQRALGLPTPRYLHTPLVLAHDGDKLSKQNGAVAVDTREPLVALQAAASALGLPAHAGPLGEALSAWVGAWRDLYNPGQ